MHIYNKIMIMRFFDSQASLLLFFYSSFLFSQMFCYLFYILNLKYAWSDAMIRFRIDFVSVRCEYKTKIQKYSPSKWKNMQGKASKGWGSLQYVAWIWNNDQITDTKPHTILRSETIYTLHIISWTNKRPNIFYRLNGNRWAKKKKSKKTYYCATNR